MLRVSRLADYAVLLLADLARQTGAKLTARDLAERTELPRPTVTKLLKTLQRAGLLESRRGQSGGYALARPPSAISVVEVLAAVDGPLVMTQCTELDGESCDRELTCPARAHWRRIHGTVTSALAGLSLADMLVPAALSSPSAGDRLGRRNLNGGERQRWT